MKPAYGDFVELADAEWFYRSLGRAEERRRHRVWLWRSSFCSGMLAMLLLEIGFRLFVKWWEGL